MKVSKQTRLEVGQAVVGPTPKMANFGRGTI